ncbi:L-rhamnose-binding lectin CSL1-like [Chelmon rostratus]|uniref:L-rhamnose-binding lectin CSL1-like n=1 Tax=Chelmon rostratus TaxID=109905 RepID=UPI001BE9293E|nr:L-rhamnose-binding lectin CSL1-like [Chelmon rostratus]
MLSTRLTIITILAAARCWTSAVGQLYDVACPGVNSELQCPEGQMILVQSVEYGEISSVDCAARSQPATTTKSVCMSPAKLPWMKFICDGRESCRLSKPDPGTFNCDYSGDSTFIQITYICEDRNPNVQTVVECEGNQAKISCEKGTIDILRARFGRFDATTCTDTPSTMTFCWSYQTDPRVKIQCDSKTECEIQVTEESLGTTRRCDDLPRSFASDISVPERSSDVLSSSHISTRI